MTNKVADADADASPSYVPAPETPVNAATTTTAPPKDSWFRRCARRWFALRWHLARVVFSRPIPMLTSKFELKLGDLLLTVPLSLVLVVFNAFLATQMDVHSSGGAPTVGLMLVFAFAIRNNSPLLGMTGISFERALLYHKWFGWITLITGALHGLAYYLSDTEVLSQRRRRRLAAQAQASGRQYAGPLMEQQTSGMILLGVMAVLVLFSLPPIRRRYFELFVRFHWILFILVIVFALLHAAGGFLLGAIPWAIDALFRLVYRTRAYSKAQDELGPKDVRLTAVADDLIRVEFAHPDPATATFRYECGQFVFLCIPQISKLEWHPFSIASTPLESTVKIYIKALGDWTNKVADAVAADAKSQGTTELTTLIDGPYGRPSVEWQNREVYEHFVLFAGGIGATPMMAFANHLFAQANDSVDPRVVRTVRFVWSARDRSMVKALMLPNLEDDDDDMRPNQDQTWLPHALLQSQSAALEAPTLSILPDPNVFSCDIFLTKSGQDPNHPVDQQLSPHLHYKQRPKIRETLRDVGVEAKVVSAEAVLQETRQPARVAVFVCGPAPLVEEVTDQSRQLSRELGMPFDVHQETFLF